MNLIKRIIAFLKKDKSSYDYLMGKKDGYTIGWNKCKGVKRAQINNLMK